MQMNLSGGGFAPPAHGLSGGLKQLLALLMVASVNGAQPAKPLFPIPAATVSVNVSPAVTGDFNEDGLPDIAIGGVVMTALREGGYRNALVNVGDNASLEVADFNLDEHLDLASANAVRLGRGDGTFAPPVAYGTAYSPRQVAVGEF
ncbi:MAG TPA: hypothetical protein VFQ07_00880, partial [Candidatus Polarisedimenticolia bacterium]|nr:hypothetical protein [Candidatus Polarisedimenticolia bacterium]